MSSRRLVNRGRATQDSSVQDSRHRNAEQTTTLPPYSPPTCALTPSAKRALENLRASHDYAKYKKHLDGSIKAISDSVSESNERVRIRKEDLARKEKKWQEDGQKDPENQENSQEHIVRGMENKVAALTAKADKAIRDLIDYGDELSMKDTMLKAVSENIAALPAPRPAARKLRKKPSHDGESTENEEADIDEDGDSEEEGSIVSAVEMMKKAQEEYAAQYASKSMRLRYDTNDYRNFKRLVVLGLKGDDAPVPHARTWFTENDQDDTARSGSNDEDSDDDVVIERVSINLKCPLTLQTFKEPYSNDKCKHVYEKSAILEYLAQEGTVYGRHRSKQIKCIQVGCEAMLEASDFHLDTVLLRHIKQAAIQAARDLEGDDDEDDPAPRGTQRKSATQIEEDDDAVDVEAEQSRKIVGVKREHRQSHRSSQPQPASTASDEVDAMDTD